MLFREVLVVPGELPPEFAIDDESIVNGAVIDLIKYYNNVFITRYLLISYSASPKLLSLNH